MTDTNTASTVVAKTPLQELNEELNNKGKIVFMPGDDNAILADFLEAHPELIDWTAKAPKEWPGLAIARERTEDETLGEIRLVAFADRATALGDPALADFFYEMYVSRTVRSARSPDANEGQFITVSGPFSSALDPAAYRFQSKSWCNILEKKGLKNAKPRALQYALQNAAYASAFFPTFKQWDQVLDGMAKHAEAKGYNSSIFAHWKASRNVATLDMKDVDLGDMSAIDAQLDELEKETATEAAE